MASYIVMWIHLVAVAAWIGGLMATTFVVRPAMNRSGISSAETQAFRRIENGFRTVRWAAILSIIGTGFFNLLNEGASERLESVWGAVLMVKILVAAIAMGLTGVNDFIISVPSSTSPSTPPAYSRWISDGVLALTLIILFLGVYLSRS